MEIDRQRLYEAVLGLAIGDALGVPAEFMHREVLKQNPITTMIGGGCWEVSPGTWSDDTAMTLATIDALNMADWNFSVLVPHIIMMNFEMWYRNDKFAALNHRFDIGNTCEKAIKHYIKTGNIETCGCGNGACGNGALMRILPTMFLGDMDALAISRLTHNNRTTDLASLAYIRYAKEIMAGADKKEALEVVFNTLNGAEEYEDMIKRLNKNVDENRILSTGYVVDTLEAAIWCFLNTDNYKDCVLKAVNLGDDTDTVAAVAGGLAGIYYGINDDNGIPHNWIDRLNDHERLKSLCFGGRW